MEKNKIQLNKHEMDLNTWKMKNHPLTPDFAEKKLTGYASQASVTLVLFNEQQFPYFW